MVSYLQDAFVALAGKVLILIVMDNGLLPPAGELKLLSVTGLNPYCNG